MAIKSLILLGLLAGAVSLAASECDPKHWKCKDGSQCVSGNDRCDGRDRECGDGSDEEGCDALPTVALPANAWVTARVQYATEHDIIELHLCGDQHCSRVWLRGEKYDGTLRHDAFTNCNHLGRYCNPVTPVPRFQGVSSPCALCEALFEGRGGNSRAFPPGEVVLEVEHRPGQLAVWRQGRPDDVVTVPVEADYGTLRVRPWEWGTDMPVQFTDPVRAGRWKPTLITPTETAPSCDNGGEYIDGVCQCLPGFDGPSCETACGPDRYGKACALRCSETLATAGRGCGGVLFCAGGACLCAAGLHGTLCNQVCQSGSYGAGCAQRCGQCVGGCDPYTGECLQGCQPGFRGASCQQELVHLVSAPNVSAVTAHSVAGWVRLEDNVAGSGEARFLALQHRVPGGPWTTGPVLPPSSAAFSLDGLPADAVVDVRALLLDAALQAFHSVPHTRVRTLKPALLSDVAVAAATDGLRVFWNSSRPAAIEYQCVRALGCPEDCGPPGLLQPVRSGALLQGLQAGALYRVSVAVEVERVSLEAATPTDVPVVPVEALALVSASSSSVVARWSPPRSCLGLRGPLQHYRWKLRGPQGSSWDRAGNTTATVLALRDLPPGQSWQLLVAAAGTAGNGPWSAINVTTLHSPPSAPLQLAVFRWDRRTVRVRWAAPSSANGVLANYSVLVDGRQQALLAAGSSPCPAWPGLQCLSVPRAGARRLHLAVSASNQWGGHGEQAELSVNLQSGDPDPVEGLEAVSATPSSVLLRWRLPRYLRGDLQFFHVAVEAASQEATSVEVPKAVTVDISEELAVYERTLSGLQPGTAYTASVQCNGRAGPGSASVTFTTPADVKDDALDAVRDGFRS